MIHWPYPYPSSPECHCPLVSLFDHGEFDSKMSLSQCFWSEISQRVSVVFAPAPGPCQPLFRPFDIITVLSPFPSLHPSLPSVTPPSHSNTHWRRHLDLNKLGYCTIALLECHFLFGCVEDCLPAHRADSPGCIATK